MTARTLQHSWKSAKFDLPSLQQSNATLSLVRWVDLLARCPTELNSFSSSSTSHVV